MTSLPTNALSSVRTVISHRYAADRPCADGVASALLCLDAFRIARGAREPGVDVRFVNHDELRELTPEPGMLFVDICPEPEQAPAFVDAGAIVLDHHVSRKDVVATFGERGIFGDEKEPGLSGAVLAFLRVWLPLLPRPAMTNKSHAAKFAAFAGIRDTWQKNHLDWRAACAQSAALTFWPWERFATIRHPFTLESTASLQALQELLAVGDVLLDKHETAAARRAEDAHVVRVSDHRIALLNELETSDVADLLFKTGRADALVGYRIVGDRVRLSLRSQKLDVSKIADRLGGGGHQQAAGASMAYPHEHDLLTTLLSLFDGADAS